MKKILLLATCIAVSLSANSQITFQQTLPYSYFYHVHFEHAANKLVVVDQTNNQILFFNYNNSLYKTINIPPVIGSGFGYYISYLSEDLFDTDPSTFEFVQLSESGNAPSYVYHTKIYREDGTLLFSRDTLAMTYSGGSISGPQPDAPIFTRNSSTYMRFSTLGSQVAVTQKSELYKLPGKIFNGLAPQERSSSNVSDNASSPNDLTFSFPNPSSAQTKIYYQLPQGITLGNLIVYDQNGNRVQQFQVSDVFNYITVSTSDLPAGTYTYSIEAANEIIKGESIVVIH
ncbi:MAG TPA: T9SS type A sorting domain-containing protein [Chitinophagales bacterium]|nr:T9SS type A sorting domain-containing protein [Chitinophagales bacterium]